MQRREKQVGMDRKSVHTSGEGGEEAGELQLGEACCTSSGRGGFGISLLSPASTFRGRSFKLMNILLVETSPNDQKKNHQSNGMHADSAA